MILDKSIETRVALTEQSVFAIAEDIQFIRKQLEGINSAVQQMVKLEERQIYNQAAIERCFNTIASAKEDVKQLETKLQKLQSEVQMWINRGIGVWVAASLFMMLFGGALVWWVSSVTEKVFLRS